MTRVWLRWVPAAGAVVIVTAAAIAVPMAANAAATLPAKTPAQVLALAASSHVQAFSGTIEQTSDLGLPSLPTTGSSSGSGSDSSVSSTLDLLTGSHTARVYVDGSTKARIQVLDTLAERDVVRNGSDLWLYDSQGNTVEHATLVARERGVPSGTAAVETPNQLATELLAKLEPTSRISVGADVRVAGRSTYDLILRPKAADTLIGSISIAVDSSTGLPLRVDVTARGQKSPAISVGFSSITLQAPAASLFTFSAPAGSKVTQLTKPTEKSSATSRPGTTATKSVTGHGWDAVVTVSKVGSMSKLTGSSLFGELTTAVSGGRLLHTSLVNVLITSDGRIIAGSVSLARLQAVAAAQ